MDRAGVVSKLKELIAKHAGCNVKDIKETSAFTDLGIDSLDGVGLGMAIEEEFKVDVSEDDYASFQTVKQAIDAICEEKNITG